jgi:cytochrome c-type biogenesis protein
MGESFANAASSGPLLLAIGAAAIAGLVSFLSPCVLPLMPGYLSYVTGLAGADLDAALGVPARAAAGAGGPRSRRRPVARRGPRAGRHRAVRARLRGRLHAARHAGRNIGFALKAHERASTSCSASW